MDDNNFKVYSIEYGGQWIAIFGVHSSSDFACAVVALQCMLAGSRTSPILLCKIYRSLGILCRISRKCNNRGSQAMKYCLDEA